MGTESTYVEDVSIVPAPIDASLATRTVRRPEQNPALVYLARLRSKTSRVTMESALKVIAELLSKGTPYTEIEWHRLQYAHGVMIRTKLLAEHSPRTTNKMLCALRGVIEESINLGLINDNDGSWRLRLHGIRVDNDEEPAGNPLGHSVSSARFPSLQSLVDALGQAGYAVAHADIDKNGDLGFTTQEGFTIYAASGAEPLALVRDLKLVLDSDTLQGKTPDLEYVDLRFGNRVFYKLKGQEAVVR
jgi:hypothetical protein